MNKNIKIIITVVAIALIGGGIYFSSLPKNDEKLVNIMVPKNIEAYKTAMTKYVVDGGTNPAPNWEFEKKTITEVTDDAPKRSAEIAALQIETQGGKIGASVPYFKVVDGTAYILLGIHIDGWAGVSHSLAMIEPIVEKTLLQYSEIKKVEFKPAPGDSINEIKKSYLEKVNKIIETTDDVVLSDKYFIGYYTMYIKPESEYNEQKTCHAITVTSGNKSLVDSYINLVNSGNSVNRKDASGNLIVNLDTLTLSNSEINLLKASSKNSPVMVVVKEKNEEGMDAPPCYSFFEVLKIERTINN